MNAIRIIQRNFAAYLDPRNWQWWRRYKVKPLLQVTNQEDKLTQKEGELRQVREKLDGQTLIATDMERKYQQMIEEKNVLVEKLQPEELEDTTLELESEKTKVLELEKNQPDFDKVLAEEKVVSDRYADEHDLAELEAHEKETRVLSLSREELERARRRLKGELDEQLTQIEELEDEFDRDLQAREEQSEEKRRTLTKQLRVMEAELERSAAAMAARKEEMREMEAKLELANKLKEDALKQLKKLQVQVKEFQRDAKEAPAGWKKLVAKLKKKFKSLKAVLIQEMKLQEKVRSAECGLRAAESEHDQLQKEVTVIMSHCTLMMDEKRGLEARIQALEEELEEEQSIAEVRLDRNRKAQLRCENLTMELQTESENLRSLKEKQIEDLKSELSELETSNSFKAAISALKTKVTNLKKQLELLDKKLTK